MGMARVLCTRRWLGLSAVAIVLTTACALLGRWQYARSYRPVDGYGQEPAAVSLDALDSARHRLTAAVVGRQVRFSGYYLTDEQRLIRGHKIGGSPVLWVATPLRLSDGSTIEVVRGWISSVSRALESPPSTFVHVTGRIQLLQRSPKGTTSAGPRYATAIDGALLRRLPPPVRAGYVVRTAQSPPDPLSLQPVPSQPPRIRTVVKRLYLLNAFYSVQWWVFGVLVIVAWFRLFRADIRGGRALPVAGDESEVAVSAR
jgi:cytochrome oxidase assembly protein ShyY1